jgi:hypothetical protein
VQDALLVIGAELLDLHLASDAASDADQTEAAAASSPGIGVGAALASGTSYPGPAGLRLAKVRLSGHPDTAVHHKSSMRPFPPMQVTIYCHPLAGRAQLDTVHELPRHVP